MTSFALIICSVVAASTETFYCLKDGHLYQLTTIVSIIISIILTLAFRGLLIFQSSQVICKWEKYQMESRRRDLTVVFI